MSPRPVVSKAGDVGGGLVIPFNLVLGDQGIRQQEGQGDGGIGLLRLPQDGLGSVEVLLLGLQASQTNGQAVFLGSSLKPFSK